MEPRFGQDFSGVRVHTGSNAAESARAVNARAYTVGRDVVFGAGEYAPGSSEGRRLVAHELIHTIQQSSRTATVQSAGLNGQIQRKASCSTTCQPDAENHPLIYNCQKAAQNGRLESERCKRPAVGHAQNLLNTFITRYDNWQSGTGDERTACREENIGKIKVLRAKLPDCLKVDCWFGNNTAMATRMFQLCDGLGDDGKIGDETWPVLESAGRTIEPEIPTPVTPPLLPPIEMKRLPNREWRIGSPTHPGWEAVTPTYILTSRGEPKEFPHYLRVRLDKINDDDKTNQTWNIVALEGRYSGSDANIDPRKLKGTAAYQSHGEIKFDKAKEQLWYGGTGPVEAFTDESNPMPSGRHHLEIPDYQHGGGAGHGRYGTTWFRIGHDGDRYLHPGDRSLGCVTVREKAEWPNIWSYLIRRRRGDGKSVGNIKVE